MTLSTIHLSITSAKQANYPFSAPVLLNGRQPENLAHKNVLHVSQSNLRKTGELNYMVCHNYRNP